MPIYMYEHPKTGKIVEVVQGMNDTHEYVEKGIKFRRVFANPQATVDTKVNPFSQSDWMRCTAKRGMTYGDMMDESAALSEKRAKKAGKDPLKDKVIKDYEKRTGKQHPSKRKGQRIETKHFVLET